MAAALVLAACRPAPSPAAGGALAPDLTLNDLSGKPVSLSGLRGKVVLLDFWATYCGPCEESVPALDRLYREHKAAGLEVVGVSVDALAEVVGPYAKEHGMSYTVLFDAEEKGRELFKLRGLPQAFLIDREGKIVAQWFGYDEQVHADMVDKVKKAVAVR
ncbi:MAG: TlpA family protein disulfide reductase [Elusimicrobia bacterium]|nr:TlpA family protein disulfide reductase [Elusimicrobiota bacterium]